MNVVLRTTWRSALVCAAQQHKSQGKILLIQQLVRGHTDGRNRCSQLSVCSYCVCVCVLLKKKLFVWTQTTVCFSSIENEHVNVSVWRVSTCFKTFQYYSNTRQKMMIDYSLTGVYWCQTNSRCAVVCSYQRWFSKVHCRVSVWKQ